MGRKMREDASTPFASGVTCASRLNPASAHYFTSSQSLKANSRAEIRYLYSNSQN